MPVYVRWHLSPFIPNQRTYLRMRCHGQFANVTDIAVIRTKRWRKVFLARRKRVVFVIDNFFAVEQIKKTFDESPIAIVCNSSTVVAFTSKVGERIPRWIIVTLNKKLKTQPNFLSLHYYAVLSTSTCKAFHVHGQHLLIYFNSLQAWLFSIRTFRHHQHHIT